MNKNQNKGDFKVTLDTDNLLVNILKDKCTSCKTLLSRLHDTYDHWQQLLHSNNSDNGKKRSQDFKG